MSRIADRVDLAIDAVTLGQYGLQVAESAEPASRGCAGAPTQRPSRSRGDCDGAYTWDWPRSACRAS